MRRKLQLERLHPFPRKIVVGVVGGACFLAGVIMIFTPGPALVFIPLGVLLLATEFTWAEPWFERLRLAFLRARARWRLHKRRRRARP